MNAVTLDIQPLSPTVGAVINGVDVRSLSDAEFAAVKQAFLDHGVIFFRDQTLSTDEHLAFAERFGPINVNRFFKPTASNPRVAEVRKEPDQERNIGSLWHTDHSYDQIPAMGSILYAVEVPPVGGDTLFASMYAAYEGLSDGMKDVVNQLKAVHSSRETFGAASRFADEDGDSARIGNPELATQDAIHPVVIRHPETGRKALYVNANFTVKFEGWSKEDSIPLLDTLYAHAAKEEFTCRFAWQPGSIAIWDNRCTWHKALNDYHGHRRLMHRVTVEGMPLPA